MKREQGFSILEVLIGTTIFMVGMLGVAALLISSVNADSFSGNLTEATTLAASKMEVLMGLPVAHADLNDDDADGNSGLDDSCVTAIDASCTDPDQADGCDGCAGPDWGVGNNNIYRVYWNVSPDDPEADVDSIRVIVKWNDKGNERAITFKGLRSGVI